MNPDPTKPLIKCLGDGMMVNQLVSCKIKKISSLISMASII